jgi:hypothetical protein
VGRRSEQLLTANRILAKIAPATGYGPVFLLLIPLIFLAVALWAAYLMVVLVAASLVFAVWCLVAGLTVLRQSIARGDAQNSTPEIPDFGPRIMRRALTDARKRLRLRADSQEREVLRWRRQDGYVLIWTQRGRLMRKGPGATVWQILGPYPRQKARHYAKLYDFKRTPPQRSLFTTTGSSRDREPTSKLT